jgi:hypothetical protein
MSAKGYETLGWEWMESSRLDWHRGVWVTCRACFKKLYTGTNEDEVLEWARAGYPNNILVDGGIFYIVFEGGCLQHPSVGARS